MHRLASEIMWYNLFVLMPYLVFVLMSFGRMRLFRGRANWFARCVYATIAMAIIAYANIQLFPYTGHEIALSMQYWIHLANNDSYFPLNVVFYLVALTSLLALIAPLVYLSTLAYLATVVRVRENNHRREATMRYC